MSIKKTSVRQFMLPVAILKDKGSFVVYTPLLDLSSVGNTEVEARKHFVEAANLFFEELVEEDCLDEALTDLGWSKVRRKWEVSPICK